MLAGLSLQKVATFASMAVLGTFTLGLLGLAAAAQVSRALPRWIA
jgi:hypothetical protein